MDLVEYIKQYSAQGYDISSIRTFLLNLGYSPENVDGAIAQAFDLVNYVNTLISQGYTQENIRNYLLSKGYSQGTISLAMPVQVDVKHTIHISKSLGISLIILLLVSFSFVSYLMFTKDKNSELLDIDSILLNPKDSIYPGSEISYNVEIFNFGSSKRYDLTLITKLLDSSGQTIATKKQTAAVEVRESKVSSFMLPTDIEPGKYTVDIIARYSSQIASSSFEIVVVSKKTKDDLIKKNTTQIIKDKSDNNNVNKKNMTKLTSKNITADDQTNSTKVNITIDQKPTQKPTKPTQISSKPDTSYDSMSESAYFDMLIKSSDTEKICEQTTRKDLKEKCMSYLAITKDDADVCLAQEDLKNIDFCYRTFALAKENIDACKRIDGKASRDLCKMLLNTANIFKTRGVSYNLDPWQAKINFDMDEAMGKLDAQSMGASDLSIFFDMFN